MTAIQQIEKIHAPVLLERTLELFAPALQSENAVLIDATLGLGGHSSALLEAFPQLQIIGIDRDRQALALASTRLAVFGQRFQAVHAIYDQIAAVVATNPAIQAAGGVAGVLFDLGVSSLQIDTAARGFAYAQAAPLDMRMDQSGGESAAEIIATAPEGRLREIFTRYGEEPLAARYARAIIAAREIAPLTSSEELVEVLQRATPQAISAKRHPAKRVFQALRIAVNDELQALTRAIPAACDALRLHGRIVALSYHSLEDRIVKRALVARSRSSAPAKLPIELPEHRPELRMLTRGAESASESEKTRNPRAIPVRLRAASRVREA